MLAAVLAALSLAVAAPAAAQHPIASPLWSFDGTRIAWAEASGGGQHEIWSANADGTNQHRIAPGIDSLFEFAWLPSGDFLYDANYRLFRVGSDGHPRLVGSGVTFSVDRKGALVAYQTADLCPSCHGPIEVRSLSSGKTWRIAATGQNLFPALSPDGTRVAFTRFLSSGGGRYEKQGGIWIASSRGGTPVQRTTTGSCPQWSPDGRRLTYADASGLHLIDRAGGAGNAASPRRQPAGLLGGVGARRQADRRRHLARTAARDRPGDTGEPPDRPHAQPLVRVGARREPAARHRRRDGPELPRALVGEAGRLGLRRIRGC